MEYLLSCDSNRDSSAPVVADHTGVELGRARLQLDCTKPDQIVQTYYYNVTFINYLEIWPEWRFWLPISTCPPVPRGDRWTSTQQQSGGFCAVNNVK
jgi:hypothetical protein